MIIIIVSPINLLLSLVNDMLDINLIEEGKFVPKTEQFKLEDTFKFLTNMFDPQMTVMNNKLSVRVVQVV